VIKRILSQILKGFEARYRIFQFQKSDKLSFNSTNYETKPIQVARQSLRLLSAFQPVNKAGINKKTIRYELLFMVNFDALYCR